MIDASTERKMRQLLRRTFGIGALREGQQEVIDRVLQGRSTLAIMPTGAGKSLCFQLPALLLKGRTVVISPLIALMKDQCDGLRERGIAAVQLNSALSADEAQGAQAAIDDGSARIIFATPERLADPGFLKSLQAHGVALLVVDEAHCISQWGHDFRPAFLEIAAALATLGRPTVLALTATATSDVTQDIAQQLGIPAAGILNTGVYRPNLQYRVMQVTREDEKLARAIEQVRASRGAGIVFTATVKAANALTEALRSDGESVACYHGKLPTAERHAAQEAFMRGETRVMVATNAFGLGIDKADIRFVLHYQMPSDLNAYYQESGRAGRDGEPADCTLLFLHSDRAVQQFFLAGRYPALDDLEAIGRGLRTDAPNAGGWALDELAARLEMPRSKLQVSLSLLRRERLVAANRQRLFRWVAHSDDASTLERLAAAYRERREQDRQRLEAMVFYGQTGFCRWQVLLRHFDPQRPFDHCGTCDNCLRLARHAAEPIDIGASTLAPQRSPARRFELGDSVSVRRYGRGAVVAVDAHSVTVGFDGGIERCFQPEFVRPSRRSPLRSLPHAIAPATGALTLS